MTWVKGNRRRIASMLLALAPSSAVAQTDPSTWRPVVHTSSHWSFGGSFQGTKGDVPAAFKAVVLPDGSLEYKKVFHSIRVQGATINGTPYQRHEISGTDNTEVVATYTRFWGNYRIGPWTLRSEYIFTRSGEFTFRHQFQGAQPGSNTEIYQRVDYDVVSSSQNIIEYVYSPSDNGTWMALSNTNQVNIAAQPKYWTNVALNNSFFRIAHASSPQSQFFAVFWPGFDAVSSVSPFTLTMVPYSVDLQNQTMPPQVSTQPVQYTYVVPSDDVTRPGALSSPWGSDVDQVIYLTLKKPSGSTMYNVAGKVFQRPGGRSMQVHMHREVNTPELSTQASVNGTDRSMETAMNELTDNRWSYTAHPERTRDFTPSSCTGPSGTQYNDCMTKGQLNNLMAHWRNLSGANNNTTRANYQDYRVDLLLVLARYAAAPELAAGVMFDHSARDIPGNFAAREAAAILWNKLDDEPDPHGLLPAVATHEIAHCFGMSHNWGISDILDQTIELGGQLNRQNMQWAPYTLNWYRKGMEGQIRPGRHGAAGLQDDIGGTFREYGTGNYIYR